MPLQTIVVYLADQNPSRDRSLGISTITEEMLHALSQDGNRDIHCVVSRSSLNPDIPCSLIRLPIRTDRAIGRLLADHLHFLWIWFSLKGKKDCIIFYPKGYLPCWKTSGITAAFIHDAIVPFYAENYPGSRSWFSMKYWLWLYKHSLKKADLILTPTRNSCAQIESVAQKYRIKLPRMEIVGESSDLEEKVFAAKKDYAVHLASKEPHKKTRRLLEMWSELHNRGEKLPSLLLVGRDSEYFYKEYGSKDWMEWKGRLSREELVSCVGQAKALIVSSEIEGFGLPALEACLLGTPVCYVKGTSVEEIMKHGTTHGGFELTSSESLLQALRAMLSLSRDEILQIKMGLIKEYGRAVFAEKIVRSFP